MLPLVCLAARGSKHSVLETAGLQVLVTMEQKQAAGLEGPGECLVAVISAWAVQAGREAQHEARLREQGFLVQARRKLLLPQECAQSLEQDASRRAIAQGQTALQGRFSAGPVVALLCRRQMAYQTFQSMQYELVRAWQPNTHAIEASPWCRTIRMAVRAATPP